MNGPVKYREEEYVGHSRNLKYLFTNLDHTALSKSFRVRT